MTNKVFLAIKSNRNWLEITFINIATFLIAISLFHEGAVGLILSESLFFLMLILLFFAFLNPWGNWDRKYNAILFGVSVLIFFFLIMLGIGALVKVQSKFQIPGHWAEDMAWSFGLILVVGFMAGLIGFFIFIRRKN